VSDGLDRTTTSRPRRPIQIGRGLSQTEAGRTLERAQGYLKLPNGRALTGEAHAYTRRRPPTLFAALKVAGGEVTARHYGRRRRIEFLDFMNRIVAAHEGREIRVVLDDLITHKPERDRWLARHMNARRAVNYISRTAIAVSTRPCPSSEDYVPRHPNLQRGQEPRARTGIPHGGDGFRSTTAGAFHFVRSVSGAINASCMKAYSWIINTLSQTAVPCCRGTMV
jgi:hypothetical protein